VVSMLAMGPMGLAVVGSGPAEDCRFLWMIKTCSALPLREVKSVPCCRIMACKRTLQSMSEMLCWPNFSTPASHL
jgi:hypothetical protein